MPAAVAASKFYNQGLTPLLWHDTVARNKKMWGKAHRRGRAAAVLPHTTSLIMTVTPHPGYFSVPILAPTHPVQCQCPGRSPGPDLTRP